MYLDHSKRRIEELGCVGTEAVQPCAEAEITALEAKLGFGLPGVYRELLLWCGKGLGDELSGLGLTAYEAQMAEDLRREFQQMMEESRHNPAVLDQQTLIVQYNHDGYFCFLRSSDGEDPPVYAYNPENGEVTNCCERFSDYFALLVENGPGPGGWEYLKSADDLERLSHPVSEIRGLLFYGGLQFGTVPERLFDLQELRYLNLVGKGLLELSPRIAELAFLRRLALARNSLSALPMALTQLDELEDLDLADNQLNSVIDVLRELPSLRHCSLANNPLSPEEISELGGQLAHVEFQS